MKKYYIDIFETSLNSKKTENKKEIWVKITNRNNENTIKKRLFWTDNNGILNDESVNLPSKFRDLVDNIWIEKSCKW
jgi:hypothetical protein